MLEEVLPLNPMPLIGINCDFFADRTTGVAGVRPPYVEAVEAAGGAPVLLPMPGAPEVVETLLERLDGFVMIGGDDLSEQRLGVPTPATVVPIDPRRDRADFLLLEKLLEGRKPTLAICLACQQLNVLHGGTLYQDLASDGPPELIRHYRKIGTGLVDHPIRVESDSRLAGLWDGAREATVNSSHHQAIRDIGQGLRAAAWAPDGIVEAVVVENHPFFMGVQWHPEHMSDDPRQRKLFEALVASAVG